MRLRCPDDVSGEVGGCSVRKDIMKICNVNFLF